VAQQAERASVSPSYDRAARAQSGAGDTDASPRHSMVIAPVFMVGCAARPNKRWGRRDAAELRKRASDVQG